MTNYWGIHHGKKVYPIQNYRILCLILFKGLVSFFFKLGLEVPFDIFRFFFS